ncbi:hypothetical protein QKU48_gp0256 [Fadolivirus algeromassiliense]|uniref:Uncharacterized protein n=1 Tax=Fadolivirus FV1/VV64 TaxID=3070911 RepID=A0A7D3UV62_9VIRU|nr:hypothetical protein QKU48_gp0256 [Fadolivirus algeromassiliense]QKF93714.1 hypothetical protein Fadolivirus_1_256 [Fadolivirus FV1/VV64]
MKKVLSQLSTFQLVDTDDVACQLKECDFTPTRFVMSQRENTSSTVTTDNETSNLVNMLFTHACGNSLSCETNETSRVLHEQYRKSFNETVNF